MEMALWVIAVCTVIRVIQNTIQLHTIFSNQSIVNERYEDMLSRFDELEDDIMNNQEIANDLLNYINGQNKSGDEK